MVYLASRCNRDERSNAKHQRGDYGNPYTHPDAHSGKAMSLGAAVHRSTPPEATARPASGAVAFMASKRMATLG